MKRFAQIPLLVCAAGIFALFARTVTFSYIGLDDAAYTFRNPFVAGGFSLPNIVEAFANLRHGGIWMPVTYISYMADASLCQITGIPLIGWVHFVNILLHVANFILLCKLLRMLQPSPPPVTCHLPTVNYQLSAIIAALLWAVHPLRAEPVAWIAARKELLWTFFAISGLICWTRAVASGMGLRFMPLTVVFCLLSCMSKPTAMCFPLLALLVGWMAKKRIASPSSSKSVIGDCMPYPPRKGEIVSYVAMFLVAGATGAIAAYSQTHIAGQDAAGLYSASFVHRFVNAVSAVGFYVRSTIWPAGLHIDCRAVTAFWPIGAAGNLISLAVAIVLFMLSVFRFRLALFAAVWFLVSLLPTVGLLGSFGIEAHADRFAYLPSMAFAIFLVPFLARLTARRAAITVSVVLAVLTFCQLSYWRDDAVAHERALACDPQHPRAMVHVADSLCSRRHDFDGGIAMYRKALTLADTVPKGGFNVGDVQARLAYALVSRGLPGDFQEVKRLGAKVLADFRNDRRGMMLDALGTAFMHDGDFKRAALLFKASIDAPDRFWPKATTSHKLQQCMSM
jgi:hypothetical protein